MKARVRDGTDTTDQTKKPWAAVDRARGDVLQPERPEGSFTIAEYAERYRVPASTAQMQLARLVKAGKLACQRFGHKNLYRVV